MVKNIKIIFIIFLCNVLFFYSESGSKDLSVRSAALAKKIDKIKQQVKEYNPISDEEREHNIAESRKGISEHKEERGSRKAESESEYGYVFGASKAKH